MQDYENTGQEEGCRASMQGCGASVKTTLDGSAAASSPRTLLGNQKQPALPLGIPESLTGLLGSPVFGDCGILLPKP